MFIEATVINASPPWVSSQNLQKCIVSRLPPCRHIRLAGLPAWLPACWPVWVPCLLACPQPRLLAAGKGNLDTSKC